MSTHVAGPLAGPLAGLLAGRALPSLALLAALSRLRHMQQYTRWNLALVALSRVVPGMVPLEGALVSSATTALAFQLGATDHTKRRLMRRYRVASPLAFLCADALGHMAPVVACAHWARGRRVRAWHAGLVYAWVATYYATVAGGLDCSAQYVPYPYRRQVLAVALAPVAFRAAWNRGHLAALALGAFYLREWYDLQDSVRDIGVESARPGDVTAHEAGGDDEENKERHEDQDEEGPRHA